MSWFQLGASRVAEQVAVEGATIPSLSESISRGIFGCTLMSIAGFAPWALTGRRLAETIGEAGLYATCAIVFIGLSGPLLHRLIAATGSLGKFYKLFTIAFGAYSVAWTICWMWLGGTKGSLAGLFLGATLMGLILAQAFDANQFAWKIVAALFVFNSIGYFAGERASIALAGARTHPTIDKLVWGVCYGIGLGTGLGLAFYYCQTEARQRAVAKTIGADLGLTAPQSKK